VAAEQGDTAAKIRLVSDARQQGEAFGRLGRMPAQHPPDADAMPKPRRDGQAKRPRPKR